MKKNVVWMTCYCIVISATILIVHWGNRAVTAIAENSSVKRMNTIVIDPGHGGIDGGATSCTGILESALNLDISLRLKDLFHLLGYETRMIRETDISIYIKGQTIAEKKMSDLKERVRITENTPNAIVLSIHQNHFPDSQYRGAQVFYAKNPESKVLAEKLQKAFVKSVNPGSKRQIKQSKGIYLMDTIRCPGVLIECGFLSNPEEEALLRNKVYQQKLCCVIVSTVVEFLSNT